MAWTARANRTLAGFAAATMLVGALAAPSAEAKTLDGCAIARHLVHRGDSDSAKCAQMPPDHKGSAYTIQKEVRDGKAVYVKYWMGTFTTNQHGSATVDLTIRRRLYFGIHQVYFRVGTRETKDWIRVVKR